MRRPYFMSFFDNDVYLVGGSIKDLGKRVSTFVKLSIPKGEFLENFFKINLPYLKINANFAPQLGEKSELF